MQETLLRWIVTRRTLLYVLILFVAAVAMAAAWRFTPLEQYATPVRMVALTHAVRKTPWAPFAIILTYIAASCVMFPNTALNVAVVLGVGGIYGFICAMTGSFIAAILFYLLGRRFGTASFRRLGGERLERLSGQFRKGGIPAVVSIRLLPIAPFPVVNLTAGAARVDPFAFAVGSFFGLLPGPLAVLLLGRQMLQMIRHPGPLSVLLLTGAIALLLLVSRWLRRHATRRLGL